MNEPALPHIKQACRQKTISLNNERYMSIEVDYLFEEATGLIRPAATLVNQVLAFFSRANVFEQSVIAGNGKTVTMPFSSFRRRHPALTCKDFSPIILL